MAKKIPLGDHLGGFSWQFGGGGGFRTRVRQSSASGSTCLDTSIKLTQHGPKVRAFRASLFSFNRSAWDKASGRSHLIWHNKSSSYRHL